MLADSEIKDLNAITPFNMAQLQPASYDVRLGKTLLWPEPGYYVLGEATDKESGTKVYAPYVLLPGDFVLAHTIEHLDLPTGVAAKFEGKSSLGRIGLMTHVTAGFIDPGFRGNLTLEIKNVGPHSIELIDGAKIGQLAFYWIDGIVERPYGHEALGSHYQDSEGVIAYRE